MLEPSGGGGLPQGEEMPCGCQRWKAVQSCSLPVRGGTYRCGPKKWAVNPVTSGWKRKYPFEVMIAWVGDLLGEDYFKTFFKIVLK